MIRFFHRRILGPGRRLHIMGCIRSRMVTRAIVIHRDHGMNMEEFTKCPACLQRQAQQHEDDEGRPVHGLDYHRRELAVQCTESTRGKHRFPLAAQLPLPDPKN